MDVWCPYHTLDLILAGLIHLREPPIPLELPRRGVLFIARHKIQMLYNAQFSSYLSYDSTQVIMLVSIFDRSLPGRHCTMCYALRRSTLSLRKVLPLVNYLGRDGVLQVQTSQLATPLRLGLIRKLNSEMK